MIQTHIQKSLVYERKKNKTNHLFKDANTVKQLFICALPHSNDMTTTLTQEHQRTSTNTSTRAQPSRNFVIGSVFW